MRVGIVCEGRTDFVLLEQVVLSVFGPCEVDALQPLRDNLDPSKWQSGGWTLVRAWCDQRDAERIADDMAIGGIDALVVHVDGDLCGRERLPADRHSLCTHIREAWLGGGPLPPGVVICIPAMATDTWLAAALHPGALPADLEADVDPLARLRALGVAKTQYDYAAHAATLRARIPALRRALSELERFVSKLEHVAARA